MRRTYPLSTLAHSFGASREKPTSRPSAGRWPQPARGCRPSARCARTSPRCGSACRALRVPRLRPRARRARLPAAPRRTVGGRAGARPAGRRGAATRRRPRGLRRRPTRPRSPADRLTLRSYVWPDEIHRAARADAALAVAECEPPVVRAQPAQDWLPEALPGPPGTAAVVWQSVVWQYVAEQARAAVEAAIRDA